MGIVDIIFPKKCLECHKHGFYMCSTCVSKVSKITPVCPFCKRFSPKNETHNSCRNKTFLNGVLAEYRYEGVLRKAILGLKYRFAYDLAEELANLVDLPIWVDKEFLLVPIPLHKTRQNWRGFNQAEEISKFVSRNLNLKLENELLVRTQNTISQVKLGKNERLRNLRGKFAVNNKAESKIKNAKILLFDDVWTTGATLSEAAKILKRAGAKEVWGISLAR